MIDWIVDRLSAFVFLFFALMFAAIFAAIYYDYADHRDHVVVEQITVTGRDITRTTDHTVSVSQNQVMTIPGSDVYLIFTDKEVFKAKSVDIYGRLTPGGTYSVTITGSRKREISEVKP